MTRKVFATAILAIAVFATAFGQKQITLEDIWARGTFSARGISEINSMKDGEHYCVLARNSVDKYSYKTGEKVESVCVFSDIDSKFPRVESYEFDESETHLLLSSGFEPIYRHSGVSDYYLYDIKSKSCKKLSENGKQRLTQFSPDGKKTAFVRDNNLFVCDLESMHEKQITFDGKFNEIINGTTDWVYEEEFSITKGFYWSPDSKKIAFYRFDESAVKQYNMQMWGELYPEDYSFKYPKAGEDNSVVDVLIYDLPSGKTLKLDVGSENDQYIPRIKWTQNPNILSFMRMSRLQNKMELLLANATTGSISTLYTEENNTYVEVPDTWIFLKDGKNFILNSEKDGYNHIYMYDMSGKLVRQITKGDYDVANVCGIDEKGKKIYFTSHQSSAINTELYVTDFGGKKVTKLSKEPGTYRINFSNGCRYYISNFSDANTPPTFTIHNAAGKQLVVLEDNAALKKRMELYGDERKEFGELTTSENVKLNYYIIKPANFDSTKQYPVFFYVYGGPGHQQVTNSYGYSDYYWHRMLAQNNYIVVCVDGRGTGGRGAEFKKVTYKQLGKYECIDVIEAAKWFAAKPWVDPDRIGIFGWSFGGYLSSLAILKGNDVFKAAIAVAPVTTWRYYDNIYTERFLQRPQDNPNGYDDNSPLNFVKNLKGNYLIIHGTGDDNVHFQNAADMISALENANKQFEMRIYPNKNHSIYGGYTRLNLYTLMTDFIFRKL
ncbi:MAG: S9 family peptidase [Bacteroidales bacterium]|nr:S9 family peptidase [Bacteroidales bacterium]